MVFEGILADVLNRFLGDFVENLDPSKLSVGIWGGDVKLDGLRVKDTAMDFLDLPVKLKYGSLDKLVLKIPWKNLYTEPVLANIEGLNLIIVPNRGVVYNEEKAKKNEYETKQKLLARLEENRKAKRKPKDPTADSFTEKLVAQIIKNLQISVKGIHVRYEDRHSNRHRPFAAGITLESLEFQTTDTNFKTTIHKETMKIFYKLVSLKSLAVYWNSDSAFISDSDSADNVKGTLQTTIATETSKPDDFKYLFGPISIDTRLKLNQKPEADGSNWSIPKIDLEIFMTTLSLFVGKAQYQDVLLFLEAQERFSISIRHLKHRPNLIEYRQHFAQWWKYAYTCIVEDIRRKRKNWSWEMMKNHRAMVRKYKDAWLQFRTKKTVGHEEKAIIEDAEENLDLFNLNVARQQAEMEIDRRQLTRTEDQEVQTWGSWAKSWVGGSSAAKNVKKDEGKLTGQELVDQIEKAITPEEKAKLFEAIDYQENIPATDYPKHYVENRVNVKLSSVSIAVDSALLLKFEELSAHFEQRPSASAIHLKTGVKSVSMDGCGQSMLSLLDTSKDWLSMEVITNPLEGGFDHYVGFKVAPVLLKYHAPVVNRVIDVFKPPGDVRLNQLMTAAMARYEEVKARSATGLQYAVEQKAKLKLEIRLEPATVIVSHGGSFDEQKSTLMAELGVLTINTVDDLSKFHCSDAKDEKLRKLYNQAYDKFQMRLSNVQVVFADSYKKCMDARGDNSSPFHILKPMQAELNLCKATIEDVQLPMLRVYGDLPKVGLCISDERLTQLLDLLFSIPTPVFEEEGEDDLLDLIPTANSSVRDRAKMKAIMDVKGIEDEDLTNEQRAILEEAKRKSLVYEFTIGEMSALLCSRKNAKAAGECMDLSDCALAFGELNLTKLRVSGHRTEDGSLKADVTLYSLTMDDRRKDTQISRLLDKKASSPKDSFFRMVYEQHASGEKKVDLTSSKFYLLLSPEFLGALSNFVVVPNRELPRSESQQSLEQFQKQAASTQQTKPRGGDNKNSSEPISESLTMMCDIREVEVILIENSFKPEDSQALILSFSTTLNAQKENGVQHFDGSVQNLQITSTYFAEEKRNLACYSVLQRLDILLSGSIAEESKDQEFTICTDKVHLKVSPSVIRLLSTVASQFSAHQSTDESKRTDHKKLKEYPNYWEAKKIEKRKYWFFKEVADAAAAADENYRFETDDQKVMQYTQKAEFVVERFVITVEAGLGDFTTPMILLESSFRATAENWSSLLSSDANMQMQMSYYNEAFSVWEPVIEPIQNKDDGAWESWQLAVIVRSHGEHEEEPTKEGENATAANTLPPKMMVSVEAKQMMNITVTKSLILLLEDLGKSFEEAAKQITPPKSIALPGDSPYLVYNETGMPITIRNTDTLKVMESRMSVDVPPGSYVGLEPAAGDTALIGLQISEDNRRAVLCVDLLGTQREVNIMRAEKRCVRLPKEADSGKQWTMLIDTRLENSRHITYLKSLVNFVNHMDYPIEIYTERGTNLARCGVAISDGKSLNVPLPALYSATGEIHFKPEGELYETSNEAISWHEFEKTKRSSVRCNLSSDSSQGIYVDCIVEEEKVMGEKGRKHIDTMFTVHLFPPLYFRNLLPAKVHISKPIDVELQGGEGTPLNVIPGLTIELSVEYDEVVYYGRLTPKKDPDDLEAIQLRSRDEPEKVKVLNLGVNWSTKHLRRDLQIYAPYWMVNNTNKRLQYHDVSPVNQLNKLCSCTYKQEVIEANRSHVGHSPGENPLILPMSTENFFDNKKAKVCIDASGWSNEFPLDTAGSQGRVTCQGNGRTYELTVDVQLCQSGLTKVVTISPFYLVQNDSAFDMEVREDGQTEWLKIAANSCVDLWPVQESKRKFMSVRYAGQEENSIMFPLTETFEGFCKISNKHLGVYVVCSVAESSSVVHIEPFSQGMVPAVIMNATNFPVKFRQSANGDRRRSSVEEPEYLLLGGQMKAFTWSDVTTHNRSLEWKCGDHSAKNDLVRNEFGTYMPSNKAPYHYWVSFLHGRQRILLFTNDIAIMTTAHEAYEVERINMQVELNLHGVGISLVNNQEGIEVLYMAMSSSGILWEQQQRNRFKSLNVKAMEDIEAEYQKWLENGSPRGIVSANDFELDFLKWTIKKKGARKSESKLRRSFQNGLWVQYRQSPHQTQCHLKLNHIQIDNQLPACVFPCVLAVVPPPKSVVADNAPKPFAEFSFIMSQSEHTNVVQIKYLHFLVQEFAIRIDNGLINAAISLFASEAVQAPPYSKETFAKDMELTQSQLSQRAIRTAASQQKAYYDDLHISPLMMHLSFSQGGALGGDKKHKPSGGGGTNIQSEFLNVILKSVGVTLTEIQDIVFKLAYFERRYVFYSSQELQAEIQSHYTMQFIKQLYVLVLGLDIIGNPYGLVTDLASGVTDLFYQPFQGAITGPEEFVEGAALGIQSLFSHTVGGAAGAVSRIAGTLGKGIAALTLDDEYQRKRQEALNRRPQNIGEGLSRGVKGVGQGVFDGVTGVFSKPIEGAKEAGAGGFVKGIGKGLVGVVARPVSGVVDFASGTLDVLKTVASNAEEAKSIRPPRLILSDQIIRPYSFEESLGYKIFRETDRGKFVDTDQFVTHAIITERLAFVVTDQRVIASKYQDILGNWTTDWVLNYIEIKEPKRTEKGVTLELKQKRKGFLGIGGSSGKSIEFRDASVKERVANRLINAYETYG